MAVTIQQAAANAFTAWLSTKMPGIPVEPRWPSPDKQKPQKSITLVTAGPRRDTPIDLRVLKKTNVGLKQTSAVWQVAACIQPVQLDVWATRDVDRDDLMAQLDTLLSCDASSLSGVYNPMPVGHGNLIAVQDGWQAFGTVADFSFSEPDCDNEADTAPRDIYRATYSGNAYFMLTVTTLTARQLAANFVQRISETDQPSTFP